MPAPPAPASAELMTIARSWNLLSEGFKKVYQQATEIPASFRMFRTPGFGIEIYYAESGSNAPAPDDMWHADSLNWRKRIDAPNDVPDYIDDVAWAIDSVWCMEVNRFGFPSPHPYKDSIHPSNSYKIMVEALGSKVYGTTFPFMPDSGTGFCSLFSIRNTWDGWNINSTIDYETHPEKGIRITCAHEFFHAIQYRMVHAVKEDIYLDDFPVSWLEGTAVMMEDCAFPDINDYIQYSESYFKSPSRFTAFEKTIDATTYSNGLICMYIYSHPVDTADPIDFFRSIMQNNMTDAGSFDSLLLSGTNAEKQNWADLLNKFHTSSFFTSSNSSNGMFLDDAQLLPPLTYTPGDGNNEETIVKTVRPWSVQFTSYRNNNNDDSTLILYLTHPSNVPTTDYAVRIILHSDDSTIHDSIMHISNTSDNLPAIVIPSWWKWDEVIVVATNGMAADYLDVELRFSTQPVPAKRIPTQPPAFAVLPSPQPTYYLLDGKKLATERHFRNTEILYSQRAFTSQGLIVERRAGKPRMVLHLR